MTSYPVEPHASVDMALAVRPHAAPEVARELRVDGSAREPRSDLARPIGLPRTVAERPLLRLVCELASELVWRHDCALNLACFAGQHQDLLCTS